MMFLGDLFSNRTRLDKRNEVVYNKNEVSIMKKMICADDKIWGKILKELPKDNNYKDEEKLLLVNVVLYLLSKKADFSLQLNWKQLESANTNDLGFPIGNNLNTNSLRRKFDRWRNNGVWANLLPIFYDNREYRWVTENGTYEVLLGCAKLVRDKSRDYKQYLEMVNDGYKSKEKDTEIKFKKKIEELEQELKKAQIECEQQKRKLDTIETVLTKKFNKERIELTNKASKAIYDKNCINKLNRFYVRKLNKYGYLPWLSKRPNQDIINNFSEILKIDITKDDFDIEAE